MNEFMPTKAVTAGDHCTMIDRDDFAFRSVTLSQISSRVQRVKPSATIAVSSKARELRAAGRDILSLSMGEPDFDTPRHIKQAAVDALNRGDTKYPAVDGSPALKAAIIDKFKRENQLDYSPEQIIVSTGAKQAIFNMLMAVMNEDHEAIIPAPYWVSYPDMVDLTAGKPVILRTDASTHFKITAQQLESAINRNSRLLMMNSPSNPSGMAYTADELGQLGEVLRANPHVMVCSDEIYEHIYWGREPLQNLLNVCPELRDRMIIINGVSKAYAMTGWRIGYAAAPAEVVNAMKKVQGQSTSGACSIAQAAAAEALSGDQSCLTEMCQAFKARHDYLIPALDALPGVSCSPGDGAFYALPSFAEAIAARDDLADDLALAEALLDEVGIAAVPGSPFGIPGHLRLSFAASMETLEEAIRRLQQFLG